VKHGEGPSCEDLEKLHPGWFSNEPWRLVLPLGAKGLKLPSQYPEKAVSSVREFLAELQTEIEERKKAGLTA
jgi:hypothetical protein